MISQKNSHSKQHQFVLLALMISLGLILFSQMRPYIGGFMGAFTFYVILRGQMKWLVEKKGWNRGLAAGVILLEALFIFLLPLTGLGFLVVDTIMGIEIDPNLVKDRLVEFVGRIENRFNVELFTPENLSFIPKLGSNLLQTIAANSYSIVINTVVILFVLYFMLFGYRGFENAIREILPFNKVNKANFVSESKLIIQANALGVPLLAIIQGGFAYIGYLIFGASSPLLYAIITAFATIIPIVGSAIIFVPLSIGLIVQSKIGAGVGLMLYGFIVVGNIDYIARFILQKKLADIHPLITIFGVLIGLPMFGFWGVIFGPLLISLFMLFFNMYRHDYIEGSVAEPTVSGKKGSKLREPIIIPEVVEEFVEKKSESEEEEENPA